MSTVNKQSLREEFDALKGQFEHLCADGKMGPESRALVQAMLMLFELLMAVFMEKRTTKDSRNSSKPSSQTPKDETAESRPGAKGKGKGENNVRSGNTRTVETVEVAEVHACENLRRRSRRHPVCRTGENARRSTSSSRKWSATLMHRSRNAPGARLAPRDVFLRTCPVPCSTVPASRPTPLNMIIAQMVSFKRVQQSIKTLIGHAISEATMLKYIMQLHQCLEPWEDRSIEEILTMPAMHVDETSLRVDKRNCWIHVCSAGDITLKFLHPKRGTEAIEAIGVIPRYGGVVIHDCWQSYLSYDHCGHGLCGSHLLRELTFIVDANGYKWASNMKRLLQETCIVVAKRRSKKLSPKEYGNLQKRYRNILTRGEKELPPIPPRQNGKRGRIAKSDATQPLGTSQTP